MAETLLLALCGFTSIPIKVAAGLCWGSKNESNFAGRKLDAAQDGGLLLASDARWGEGFRGLEMALDLEYTGWARLDVV